MKFCPECGARRLDGARFCQGCGFAYPGASNQALVLGLSVVVFLSGATYFLVKRVIQPNYLPEVQVTARQASGDDHQHSPDDGHDHRETTVASASTGNGEGDHTSGASGTRFERLEQFFRSHEVVGPKVFMFTVPEEDSAILWVHQFPMDQMPPAMRTSFDQKVRDSMAYLGEGATLEIRDAQSRALLGNYAN